VSADDYKKTDISSVGCAALYQTFLKRTVAEIPKLTGSHFKTKSNTQIIYKNKDTISKMTCVEMKRLQQRNYG